MVKIDPSVKACSTSTWGGSGGRRCSICRAQCGWPVDAGRHDGWAALEGRGWDPPDERGAPGGSRSGCTRGSADGTVDTIDGHEVRLEALSVAGDDQADSNLTRGQRPQDGCGIGPNCCDRAFTPWGKLQGNSNICQRS